MTRIYRILFFLFVVAGSVRTFAQTTSSSEVGVWIVGSQLSDSAIENDVELGDVTLEFDEGLGYGVSFNHYWTENFSTELSMQKLSADMVLRIESVEVDQTFDVGELDATALTALAQWHFHRAGRFAPYIGGGISRIDGDVEVNDDPEVAQFDLESELTWSAAVGANIRLTDRVFLAGEVKYTPWSALAEDDEEEESIDLDPITYAAGVKFRF